jgi:putative membrane protein
VFIDYITLMLVNMAAGLLVLACFFVWGLDRPGERAWSAGLAVPGLIAFATGLHTTLTWPIPKLESANLAWANPAYGETSIMLGALFLAAALATARGWSLVPVALYGLVAGATAILIGMRIMDLGLTQTPTLTAVGYFVTGSGGILALAAVLGRKAAALRFPVALALVAGAAIWLWIGFMGYWTHLERFSTL